MQERMTMANASNTVHEEQEALNTSIRAHIVELRKEIERLSLDGEVYREIIIYHENSIFELERSIQITADLQANTMAISKSSLSRVLKLLGIAICGVTVTLLLITTNTLPL